ncbi:MAG: hypothetical protein D6689_11030 [Deltaproteobacteria bacterium]|nr:MAG: hypothetical protein D6689_11030 [Deltaproteobacteria bacterium]
MNPARRRVAVAMAAAIAACGDGTGPSADAGPARADAPPPPPDAAAPPDAPPPPPDAPPPDASPDAAWRDGAPPLPDLIVRGVTRTTTAYRVEFCNDGDATAPGRFRVELAAPEQAYATPAAFAVPGPGACAVTGDITCGLLGDPGCDRSFAVTARVDSDDAIAEADESNNAVVVTF